LWQVELGNGLEIHSEFNDAPTLFTDKFLERSPEARILGPVLGIRRRRWRAGGGPPKPIRPLCQGMLTHEYTYAFGAVDVCTGELNSLILPHVNTGCMQLFVNEV
jgi:hypothetical protein